MSEKTYVDDINRNLYDFRNEESDKNTVRFDEGLTPEIVEKISSLYPEYKYFVVLDTDFSE